MNKDILKARIIPRGKYITYIKSKKETNRARLLIEKAIDTRAKVIDEYIETSVRRNYKPELEKAVASCNERGAQLLVPNISHLARNLTACEIFNRIDGSKSTVTAIREVNRVVACYKYGTLQMMLQAFDRSKDIGKDIKKSIAKKMKSGWQPGNKKNLNTATLLAAKARRELADDYVRQIIPRIRLIQSRIHEKATLQQIADALMAQKVLTRTGKETWTPIGVSNILKKAKKLGI
tara:strand:- start:33 stop:737 length:705 start_codon:yes stop_codon:yes gene_type:complete